MGWTEQEWAKRRAEMVAEQLSGRGITDPRVLAVLGRVPRHEFVPPEVRDRAYEDRPLPIGEGQTVSQPYMVALMTECLGLQGTERVLEVGTGSGYQTAVLLELAGEVFSVERNAVLAARARETLERLGYRGFEILVGNGSGGWPAHAPYDGIVVTANAPRVPEVLREQLRVGGRLVIPVGSSRQQELRRVVRHDRGFSERVVTGCVFVPLVGQHGWASDGELD